MKLSCNFLIVARKKVETLILHHRQIDQTRNTKMWREDASREIKCSVNCSVDSTDKLEPRVSLRAKCGRIKHKTFKNRIILSCQVQFHVPRLKRGTLMCIFATYKTQRHTLIITYHFPFCFDKNNAEPYVMLKIQGMKPES